MSAEQTGEYFHSFESDALPNVDWQEMLDKRVVFAPQNVITALKEAEQLLVTHPGPNLERRKVLAPEWFNYWKDLLNTFPHELDTGLVSSGDKLVKFGNLSGLLETKYKDENTGMLFVAGAEGHKGHVHAARYMARVVPVSIWGFEQDDYMQRKVRQAPFLSLPLRLSMWFYEPTVTHLTVLPRKVSDIPDNDHYNELFIRSGVKYFFVHENDPYLSQKLARGMQDLDRTIRHPFPTQSTTEAVQELMPEVSLEDLYSHLVRLNLRVIPHLTVARTSSRVQKLLPDKEELTEDGQILGFHRFVSTFTDFDLLREEMPISYDDTMFIE